jgi:hypothetical protein
MGYLANAKQQYQQQRGKREAPTENTLKPIQPTVITNAQAQTVDLPVETTFGGGFQVHNFSIYFCESKFAAFLQVIIQTSEVPNSNILIREELLRHVEILEQIANYSIEMFGE